MKNSLLDLRGTSDETVNRETYAEYEKILENPDLLGRLFRLFMFKNASPTLWKDCFDKYIERNAHQSKQWHTDRQTNLTRNLFRGETVTWKKFLEGLVVISSAYDDLELSVFSTLNEGNVTKIKITRTSLDLDDVKLPPIPKGEILVPDGFERSPLEPLPLKVVRDAITPIGTSAEFRQLVRDNIREYTPATKLGSSVNSLYVSVLKSEMTWKRMTAILFALGATQMVVSIRAIKHGRVYKAIAQVQR